MKNEIFKKIKAVVFKEDFIQSLCYECGCAEGVADALNAFVDGSPLLRFIFQKDIESFEKEEREWVEFQMAQHKEYLEELQRQEEDECYRCPMGNGEGGCTIPGYCPRPD